MIPDYYQTFYRNYDAAIGRFVGVDPQLESSESMTPYQYASNNPLMKNDPMGNSPVQLRGHPYSRTGVGNYGTFHYNFDMYDAMDAPYVQNADVEWENGDQYLANHGDIGAISRLYGGTQTIWRAGMSDQSPSEAIEYALGRAPDGNSFNSGTGVLIMIIKRLAPLFRLRTVSARAVV